MKKNSLKTVPKPPVDRKQEALVRAGIDLDVLAKQAPITEMLKETAGGRKAVIQAMRFSSGAVTQAFLEKYDSLPLDDRDRLPLEAICIFGDEKIDPSHLLGETIAALREYSVAKVKIIATSNHAALVKKRVEFAKLAGGVKDRDAIDQALGFLPQSKGISIFNRISTGGQQQEPNQAKTEEPEELSDIEYAFPDLSKMQDKLTPVRQKMLESGK